MFNLNRSKTIIGLFALVLFCQATHAAEAPVYYDNLAVPESLVIENLGGTLHFKRCRMATHECADLGVMSLQMLMDLRNKLSEVPDKKFPVLTQPKDSPMTAEMSWTTSAVLMVGPYLAMTGLSKAFTPSSVNGLSVAINETIWQTTKILKRAKVLRTPHHLSLSRNLNHVSKGLLLTPAVVVFGFLGYKFGAWVYSLFQASKNIGKDSKIAVMEAMDQVVTELSSFIASSHSGDQMTIALPLWLWVELEKAQEALTNEASRASE